MSFPRSSLFAWAAALVGLLPSCQKSEDHPPFAAACEVNCPLLPGISVGLDHAGGSSGMNPDADAGVGTLEGQVLLLGDDSFVQATLYKAGATVTADGASGSPVNGIWEGNAGSPAPYQLEGVARLATNWVSVKPELAGGDALPTYQAVRTNQVTQVDLALVSAAALDGIFTAASTLRSPESGQIVLFFRSVGTGAALAGLHVTMAAAQAPLYASATGWVLDDGTAVTNQSGLVVFGNVAPANAGGTQTLIVTRAATATTAAAPAGQFAVKVVQGAVTLATVGVQL